MHFLVRGFRAAAALAALVLSACSSAGEPSGLPSDQGHTIQPIIGGSPSGAEHDAVVVLGIFQDGTRRGLCSATLVAPNLVLTARHCVSDVDDQVSCWTDGSPVVGAGVHADHAPGDIVIFAGKNGVVPTTTDASQASARGKTLVVDEITKTICNHDLAFVVLDRALSAPVAKIRLGAPAMVERLTIVGWGITQSGTLPATRMERAGVPMIGAGPMLYPDDAHYGVAPSEFMIGESACLGDSGGPALSPSGTVVGVASRAGNGLPRDPNDLASTCTGPHAHAIYTHFGPNAETLALQAFAAAGATPDFETPPLASAEAPAEDDPGAPSTSSPADAPAAPAGDALLAGTITADTAPTPPASAGDGGCRASPARPHPAGSGFALALGVALAAARIRRGSRARARRRR